MSDNSFYVQAYFNGGMNSLEVIPQGHRFAIAYDGRVIAEVERNPDWQQVTGNILPDEVLTSIFQEIDNKKS